MNLQNSSRLTDLENKFMVAGGRDSQGVWDGHVHSAMFKMDNQQGPTVQHMELCPVLCDSLDWRGVWGRKDTCICMAQSPPCLPESIIALLVNWLYPNTKLNVKKIKYFLKYDS